MKLKEVTLKLSEPVKFGSEAITELVVKRPKAKNLRGLVFGNDGIPASVLLDMAVDLCDQPKKVIDELEGDDALRLMEIIGDFLNGGQKTGKNP